MVKKSLNISISIFYFLTFIPLFSYKKKVVIVNSRIGIFILTKKNKKLKGKKWKVKFYEEKKFERRVREKKN